MCLAENFLGGLHMRSSYLIPTHTRPIHVFGGVRIATKFQSEYSQRNPVNRPHFENSTTE